MSGFWSSETIRSRRKQRPEFICPFDDERVKHAAYELSMGNQAYVTGEKDQELMEPLGSGQRVQIPAGQFALLLTKETIEMPDDAVGLLSIKSKHKLRGLISVSGFHVDPGYKGRILYSVYNAGPKEILIDQDDPVFLLWYAGLDNPTSDLYGHDGGERTKAPRTQITADDIMEIKGTTFSPQALAAKVEELERRTAFWQFLGRSVIGATIVVAVSIFIGWVSGFEIRRAPGESQDSGQEENALAVESNWEAAGEQGQFVELDYSLAEAMAGRQH
ncbi:dCTP deaminase domain-containing protein [Candidatus Poriferisodalis sp.]|uniref:dCTP deaminase domain-containing protein n=1 Tax=Candidatus Poriferisodalis sp. TaxID=3101277 RepID=UPI003B01AC2F